MAKLLGYLLMLIGLVIILVKLAFSQIIAKIPTLSNIKIQYVIIVGIVLIAVGLLFAKSGKRQTREEVPIYEGKRIVGYRRR